MCPGLMRRILAQANCPVCMEFETKPNAFAMHSEGNCPYNDRCDDCCCEETKEDE